MTAGGRPSRAFWVIPCQPVQRLYGAQGDDPDPVAATVLMAMIAGMSMNDGFNGVPASHISISQRELAERTGLSHKAVRNALQRLQKRAHITPIRAPSDGTRRGTNARIVYRIDLLADEATAFHGRGTPPDPSVGTRSGKKGTSYIQTESSDREQTTATAPAAPEREPADQGNGRRAKPDRPKRTARRTQDGEQTFDLGPYLETWKATMGAYPQERARAHLGGLLKSVEREAGPETTLARWRAFVHGIKQSPKYIGTPSKQFERFAATPAIYDDPDWYLSDRERAEMARLLEGL